MRQRWAHLLFLHWRVDPTQITPLLPPGLELDTFDGLAYIGLVPFTMTGVHPWWAPPFKPLSDFHETNVRTYVHKDGADPGVWFFTLDAANSLAVRIARAVWKLPYHRAEMRLDIQMRPDAVEIIYATNRLWLGPTPARCSARYSPTGLPTASLPGTLEHFLIERYLLYAYRNGQLYRGQVHHTPYPIQKALVTHLEENLVAAAGIEYGDEAPLAHYASEVKVRIYALKHVTG